MNLTRRNFLTKITRSGLAGLAGLASLKLKGAPAVLELAPKEDPGVRPAELVTITDSQGTVWSTNSLGDYMYSAQLSRNLRKAVQPGLKFGQFGDL